MRWIKVVNDTEILTVHGACKPLLKIGTWCREDVQTTFHTGLWQNSAIFGQEAEWYFNALLWLYSKSAVYVFALVLFQSYLRQRHHDMGLVACCCCLFVPGVMQWVVQTFLMLNWAFSQWVLDSSRQPRLSDPVLWRSQRFQLGSLRFKLLPRCWNSQAWFSEPWGSHVLFKSHMQRWWNLWDCAEFGFGLSHDVERFNLAFCLSSSNLSIVVTDESKSRPVQVKWDSSVCSQCC